MTAAGEPARGSAPGAAERTRAAVERYLTALNDGDPDAVASCVTHDFVNEHTSARGTSVTGRDAYRARLGDFLAQFAALHYDAEDWIVDGDRAAVPYRMTCRWHDAQGDEHPITIRGMFRFRVRDDLIDHRIDYWDGEEFQRQISEPTESR